MVVKKVRPKELTEFLSNPHKGCSTFQRFNGDDMYPGLGWSEVGPVDFPERVHEGVTPGYLPCTVAYCRWFWELFEHEEGKYDWSVIEKALAVAKERGQTLQVRLMPHGSSKQPKVPQWYRDKYKTVDRDTHGRGTLCNCPVYDSPEFVDKWGGVVTDFGRRFDGHPQLESVDISYIGPWGEGAGECSEEAVEKMTQIYVDAHPKTPLMTMISGPKMRAGVKRGTGWRLDCFGDLGIFPREGIPMDQWWMHHFDCYPMEVCKNDAQDAWRNGPITFETCSVPMKWFKLGFDLEWILKQGLKFHGTVFMPKSTKLPDEYTEPLLEFCNDIGYRFVLRQFRFDSPAEERKLSFACWIENVGVAPIYHPYDFAVRLTQGNRKHVWRSSVDVHKILPGDAWIEDKVAIPKEFQAGSVMLHAGLIDRKSDEVKVRFAVEGADPDGWVPLDTVEIA